MNIYLIKNTDGKYWSGYPFSMWTDKEKACRYETDKSARLVIKKRKLEPCFIIKYDLVLSEDCYVDSSLDEEISDEELHRHKYEPLVNSVMKGDCV